MRTWTARLLIALVTAWNLQAAFVFMFFPGRLVGSYELSGAAGEAAVRGAGVLFLMWSLPYLAALWDPIRYKLALALAAAMQCTGLIGEGCILFTLPGGHGLLSGSILRFIAFDGAGLLLLLIAWLLVKRDERGLPRV